MRMRLERRRVVVVSGRLGTKGPGREQVLTIREKFNQVQTGTLLAPLEQRELEAGQLSASVGKQEVLERDGRVERQGARVGARLGRARRRVPVRQRHDSVVRDRDKADKTEDDQNV